MSQGNELISRVRDLARSHFKASISGIEADREGGGGSEITRYIYSFRVMVQCVKVVLTVTWPQASVPDISKQSHTAALGVKQSLLLFWKSYLHRIFPWWRYQMETLSALLAICAGNSPVTGEFPTQRPVTRSFDVYFDLRPNKRLSKQLWGWWFETQSRPLWRHRNADNNSICFFFNILHKIVMSQLVCVTDVYHLHVCRGTLCRKIFEIIG